MMKAGIAERDITPAVGMEITHPVRISLGVHDPLYIKALFLDDEQGTELALVCSDLIGAPPEVCGQLKDRVRDELGIENILLNFSHPHSSRGLGSYAEGREDAEEEKAWADATRNAYIEAIAEARGNAVPVSLRAGRAAAQVGFNRRVVQKSGNVHMAVNETGPVVPWVNVLVVDHAANTGAGDAGSDPGGPSPLAVLFEHAAHPVIVPDKSGLISADFPAAAVARVREKLGKDVMAMFAQGCQGNINGFPLRSTHEKADEAGFKLGDAVLQAVTDSEPISCDRLTFSTGSATLPTRQPPPVEEFMRSIDEVKEESEKGNPWWPEAAVQALLVHTGKLEDIIRRGDSPPPWTMDATVVGLGDEWGLVTFSQEMFCQYELWVDANAPFKHNMTFGLTNGSTGYVAVDEAWTMGVNGGYEASCLPRWNSANVMTGHFNPPAVGSERLIKELVMDLWRR
jgi:neutral ceramidase